jgi:hypothetical protein
MAMAQTMEHWESLVGALRSVQILRLHRGSSPILHGLAADPFLLPHLQKLYVVQYDIGCAIVQPAEDPSIVPWNLKRLTTLRGSPPGMARDLACTGDGLVALVRGRYGLEVVLAGCNVDTETLDELGKHGQVSIGDEWVYV